MFGTLSSCVLVLVVSTGTQIPKEPDFSGDWELVKTSGTPSDPAQVLIVRQTITRTTMRGEPMTPWFSDFTLARHFTTGVVSETYKIGRIGGTVPGIPPGASSPQGEWTTISATWERKSLIIRTGKYSGPPQESGPYTEHEERWSFDPGGNLLIMITDRLSGSQAASAVLTYRRLPNAVALERAVRGLCEREASKGVGTVPAGAGKGMRTPKKINPVHPAYPSLPANTRVKSNAWLGEILLDQTGRVSGVWTIRDMQFVPPFPAFNLAVVDEVRRWRFEPATIDGKAVRLCMTTSVLVDFW